MTSNTEMYNEDELVPPVWLNHEFVAKILQNSENNRNIAIKNVKLTPGTCKGDHYASIMFRALVSYQLSGVNKVKSLLIKAMPEADGPKKEMLGENHLFDTEIGMYAKVLPKFEKMLRAIDDNTLLKAPCLYHEMTPNQVIVFEDIVPLGYKVLKEREMTLEEVKFVYLKMAKWHAISYKINLENPNYFDKYRHGLMSLTSFLDTYRKNFPEFIEFLQATPSLAKYAPYFVPMADKVIDQVVASFNEYRENHQSNAFYVLCHGDFHSKNLMFKNNAKTGELEDIMLLDFQLSYVGPIANDLIYSMFMLLDAEMRDKHRDELLYYYFSNFQATLRDIGYAGEMPKLLEFRNQMMRHKHFELFMLVAFLPVWFLFRTGEADINLCATSKEYRLSFFRNPIYIAELQTLLPKYLHLGYLEN